MPGRRDGSHTLPRSLPGDNVSPSMASQFGHEGYCFGKWWCRAVVVEKGRAVLIFPYFRTYLFCDSTAAP